MANKYIWSGAGGANDGSKWEDAYDTVMKDWGAEAGFTPGTDFVYVRSIHNESNSADVTLTGTTAEGTEDPVRILSVAGAATGTSPGALTAGATVNTDDTYDIYINEKLNVYGVEFLPGENLYIGNSNTDHDITLEKVRLELVGVSGTEVFYIGSGSVRGQRFIFKDTDIDFNHANQGITVYAGNILWDGGTLLADITLLLEAFLSQPVLIHIRNVDLSACDGTLINPSFNCNTWVSILFSRCKIHASVTKVAAAVDLPGLEIEFHHCQDGTDSDPAYQMARYTYQGTTETDTARYRDNGASDGERTNPYSWSMDTSTGSNVIELYEALESPPIAGWTDGDASTSHTYRIYVASGATLQDDEVWVDLIGPNDVATDSLGVRKTTRIDPLDTPGNLTTDSSSTWNGADVGTKQQIDITYTPDKPGPITARVYVAKPAERVSVDPVIYIDPS